MGSPPNNAGPWPEVKEMKGAVAIRQVVTAQVRRREGESAEEKVGNRCDMETSLDNVKIVHDVPFSLKLLPNYSRCNARNSGRSVSR
jgi:hypothetical protein